MTRPNPKPFRRKHKRLKGAQKALARKVKGSNNRYKARLKVARIHEEIASARQDFLHKLTTRLVREKQAIAIENWAVKTMAVKTMVKPPNRFWDCPDCRTHHDRDVNAAVNGLAAGRAVSVYGVTVTPDRTRGCHQSNLKAKNHKGFSP